MKTVFAYLSCISVFAVICRNLEIIVVWWKCSLSMCVKIRLFLDLEHF